MSTAIDRPAHDAFPVRTVARMTGLSPDLIRVWEKRYRVVSPIRGPRGARLYTADDVAHLRLLARAVDGGRAIGDIARLTTRELAALLSRRAEEPEVHEAMRPRLEPAPPILDRIFAALDRFDTIAIERLLGEALIALGGGRLAREVIAPLLEEVGERWSQRRLAVSDEHLLSGLLRSFVGGLIRSRAPVNGPVVVLATPSGERHEFGLLLTTLELLDVGLDVRYLGPDLPAADVIAAARHAETAAVGLGVVDGGNRVRAAVEIRSVEQTLPATIELWLGGRDARDVSAQLGSTRALVLTGPGDASREAERLRDASVRR